MMERVALNWGFTEVRTGGAIPYRSTSLLHPTGIAHYIPAAKLDIYHGGWFPAVYSSESDAKWGGNPLWDLDYGPLPENCATAEAAIEAAQRHIQSYIERWGMQL